MPCYPCMVCIVCALNNLRSVNMNMWWNMLVYNVTNVLNGWKCGIGKYFDKIMPLARSTKKVEDFKTVHQNNAMCTAYLFLFFFPLLWVYFFFLLIFHIIKSKQSTILWNSELKNGEKKNSLDKWRRAYIYDRIFTKCRCFLCVLLLLHTAISQCYFVVNLREYLNVW